MKDELKTEDGSFFCSSFILHPSSFQTAGPFVNPGLPSLPRRRSVLTLKRLFGAAGKARLSPA
jgi:hypothetical protein